MSIEYEFTAHNTIVVRCGVESVEVLLPTAPGGTPSPGASDPDANVQPHAGPTGRPSDGRGGPIVVAPGPAPDAGSASGRPKQKIGVMAIVGNKKVREQPELDWGGVEVETPLGDMASFLSLSTDQMHQYIHEHGYAMGGSDGSVARYMDFGVVPWSGTTPAQLHHLQQVLRDDSFDLDGARFVRIPGDTSR